MKIQHTYTAIWSNVCILYFDYILLLPEIIKPVKKKNKWRTDKITIINEVEL